MGDWGPSTYGDPCRECGYAWGISVDEAITMVMELPTTYRGLLEGATGNERHPDLGWSVTEYIVHVGDNLRIWAERLGGVADGAPPEVGAYDENELADARNYEAIPLPSALWALSRSVADWKEAVGLSSRAGTVLVHPERGKESLSDVVHSNAHDAFHHGWDIERTLEAATA